MPDEIRPYVDGAVPTPTVNPAWGAPAPAPAAAGTITPADVEQAQHALTRLCRAPRDHADTVKIRRVLDGLGGLAAAAAERDDACEQWRRANEYSERQEAHAIAAHDRATEAERKVEAAEARAAALAFFAAGWKRAARIYAGALRDASDAFDTCDAELTAIAETVGCAGEDVVAAVRDLRTTLAEAQRVERLAIAERDEAQEEAKRHDAWRRKQEEEVVELRDRVEDLAYRLREAEGAVEAAHEALDDCPAGVPRVPASGEPTLRGRVRALAGMWEAAERGRAEATTTADEATREMERVQGERTAAQQRAELAEADVGYCKALLGAMPNETAYDALKRRMKGMRRRDERADALAAALRTYGRHRNTCGWVQDGGGVACDCGLDAALAPAAGRETDAPPATAMANVVARAAAQSRMNAAADANAAAEGRP